MAIRRLEHALRTYYLKLEVYAKTERERDIVYTIQCEGGRQETTPSERGERLSAR